MSNSRFLCLLGLILTGLWSLSAQAFDPANRLHEIELHSTEGVIQFSEQTSANFEANYLYQISDDWQLFIGGKYELINEDASRMGLSLGGVFNFGHTEHNQKFYVKPQINFTYFDNIIGSDSVTFLSAVVGKRIPIFAGERYTINYTPAIGLSQPLNNTDEYDLVLSLSIIGLSLVF